MRFLHSPTPSLCQFNPKQSTPQLKAIPSPYTDRGPVAVKRDQLNSALGQRFLDLSIVVDGPLLGKTVSKTVSQNYAFDQGGE